MASVQILNHFRKLAAICVQMNIWYPNQWHHTIIPLSWSEKMPHGTCVCPMSFVVNLVRCSSSKENMVQVITKIVLGMNEFHNEINGVLNEAKFIPVLNTVLFCME